MPHLGAAAHRLRPLRRLRWHEIADLLRPVRIRDVEHAHARTLPSGEDRGRALERAGPVLVQIVRPELATHLDVVLIARNRHRRDADRIALLADVEDTGALVLALHID